jgi:hypothetical protein
LEAAAKAAAAKVQAQQQAAAKAAAAKAKQLQQQKQKQHDQAVAKARAQAAVKASLERAVIQSNLITTKKSSTNLCQKLATNCQPCQSADATECYNLRFALEPGAFASTGTQPRDSGSGQDLCPTDAGIFLTISGCGTMNAASGEGESPGAKGSGGGEDSAPLPPGGDPKDPCTGGETGCSATYIDRTTGVSIRNIGTSTTHTEFAETLTSSGWIERASKDGTMQVFTKDGAKYVLRENAATYDGWSADFTPAGSPRPTLKIRLGVPG